MPPKRFPVFYGWVIVAAGLAVWTLEPGMYASFGIFFKPIAAETGWSRATVSGAISMSSLAGALFGFISGLLADRYGPRPLIIASALLTGGAYALLSTFTALWQFYLYYLLAGAAMGIAFPPILATVVRWFDDRRGLALGITVLGTGMGTMLMPPLSNYLIALWGWRQSYLVLGLGLGILTLAAASLLRRDPRELGLTPYRLPGSKRKEAPSPNPAHSAASFPFRRAVRTMAYWKVFFASASAVFAYVLVQVHLVPYATDLAISPGLAASVMTMLGASNSLGRVGVGALSDRLGAKRTFLAALAAMTLAMLGLRVSGSLMSLYAFALVFGLAYGGAYVCLSRLPGELFGLASVGALWGLIFAGNNLGSAAGSYSAGYIFDLTGSYAIAFLLTAFLLVLASLAILLLRPPKLPTAVAVREEAIPPAI